MSYDDLLGAYLSAVMRAETELLEEQCAEAIWTQAPDQLDRLHIVEFERWMNQPGQWVASHWWPE